MLFVFLFISSMNTPRNLIGGRLVPVRGDGKPGLVPDRVRAQPHHHRLGRRGDGARLRRRGRIAVVSLALSGWALRQAALDVRIWPSVRSGVAWRTLKNVLTTPSLLLPSLIFPLFFFTAFAGGLSQLQHVPGFDYEPGTRPSSSSSCCCSRRRSAGCSPGSASPRDFEYGFARRLLLAAPNRSGIVLGYAHRRARALADHGDRAHRRRARRGDERRRRRGRSLRSLRSGAARQRRRLPLVVRGRDAARRSRPGR